VLPEGVSAVLANDVVVAIVAELRAIQSDEGDASGANAAPEDAAAETA
jgi:hypothetical protein